MNTTNQRLIATAERIVLGSTAILLSLVVSVAKADATTDQSAAESSDTLQEVVVTARRRAENIQDVPLSVNAFTQTQLQVLNVVDPESLGKLDPGLTLNTDNSSRQSFTPFIRGLGAAANSNSNAVIQYFAEVPNFQPSFFDLENVQVLKGPQGTLFGETATGGAVLFTPKKPTGDFDGYFNMEHGNYDYNAISAAVEFPIINDKWSVRVAGQIRKRDGFTTLINSHSGSEATDEDDLNTSEFRVSSVIKPLENLEIYTILQASTIRSNGTDNELIAVSPLLPFLGVTSPTSSPLTAAQFNYFSGYSAPAGKTWLQLLQSGLAQQQSAGIGTTYAPADQSTVNKFEGLINTITWNVTDKITLKDVFGAYKNYTSGVSANPSGTDVPLLSQIPPICQPGISPANCLTTSATNWSNEIQLLGQAFSNRLSWQTGFYYRDNPTSPNWTVPAGFVGYIAMGNPFQAAPGTCAALGVAAGTPCTTVTNQSSISYAPYFQTTYEVVKDVHLTAGYRESYDEAKSYVTAAPAYTTQFEGQTLPIVVLGTQPLPGATQLVTPVPRTANGSWTLAADWRINDELLLYVTRRKGYTPGGINSGLPPGDPRTVFQAETVKDVEAGLKGDFKFGDYSMRMDIDAYYMKFSGIQEKTDAEIDGQFLGFTGNVAAATIQGVDLTMLISRSPWYDLSLLFNWNDAKYTNWTDVSTCAAESYRPACLNPSYTVTTNHVAGIVTVTNPATGQVVGTQNTPADLFVEAPKFKVTLRPALHLGFLGESFAPATLSANIYYTSSYTDTDINLTSGDLPSNLIVNGFVQADMRLDWKNIAVKNGVSVDFYAQVTNVTDRRGVIAKIDTATFDNTVQGVYNEPRMYFAGFSLKF
jgi:iron complex outermembrane recepter protein